MAVDIKKQLQSNIWVEAFRPPSVKDMVLPANYMKDFQTFLAEKNIPNLLFYSSSGGTGKTTIAKAICNDIEADMLYINISKDSGIDTLRTTIARFASTASFEGGQKVIILDEFDGAGIQLQKGLRADIEQFSTTCRFIFTANYVSNILPQLRSRTQEYNFNYTESELRDEMLPKVFNRVKSILTAKKVSYDEDTLKGLIEKKFPDIRKTIQLCQQYTRGGKTLDSGVFNLKTLDENFVDLLKAKKINSVRKYVIDNGIDWSEMYSLMFNIVVPVIDNAKKPMVIEILARYQFWDSTAMDKELNFAACICEIMRHV